MSWPPKSPHFFPAGIEQTADRLSPTPSGRQPGKAPAKEDGPGSKPHKIVPEQCAPLRRIAAHYALLKMGIYGREVKFPNRRKLQIKTTWLFLKDIVKSWKSFWLLQINRRFFMTQSTQQGQNNPSQKPGQAEQSAPNQKQPGQPADKKQDEQSKQQK